MYKRLFLILMCLSGTGLTWAGPAALSQAQIEATSHLTEKGLYRVSLHPPSVVTINSYQTWGIYIEDATGAALDKAVLKLSADMPAHGHGLLTEPRIRPGSAPGRYRVEGLRFHMPGYWEIRVQIGHADKSDDLRLAVELE